MIDPAYPLDIVTWFLPGLIVTIVISLLLAGPLSRRMGESRVVVWLLLVSLGTVIAATLTPVAPVDGIFAAPTCDLERLGFASIGALRSFNDTSLNVALFVPLGVSVALLHRSRCKASIMLGAVALPFVIEGLQLAVPPLGRGCQSADVIDNLTGLVIGLGTGVVIGWLMTFRHQKDPSD